MAEYTYEDIIMDPDDPRLEGAIGKECYFSEYPKRLLSSARNNSPEYLDCLTDIRKEGACTFVDKNGSAWTLIIIKKEEPKPKPKYVPFKSNEEFLESYIYHKEKFTRSSLACRLYSLGGIWLKHKGIEDFFMITEFWDDMTRWGEFLERFTFLDGSPCGKEVEE